MFLGTMTESCSKLNVKVPPPTPTHTSLPLNLLFLWNMDAGDLVQQVVSQVGDPYLLHSSVVPLQFWRPLAPWEVDENIKVVNN